MSQTFCSLDSPLGRLLLMADAAGLTDVILPGEGKAPAAEATEGGLLVATAADQLTEWFAGRRDAFEVPLAPRGTPFQQQVWHALCAIPYGTTTTYGDVASAIGRPTASRAVGAANGRNPLPIIVPCHRVIGADGTLTGYSGGGGLATKRWLLAHEQSVARPSTQA